MKEKIIPTVPFFAFLKNANKIVKNPLPFHHKNFEEKGDTFRLKLGAGKSVIFSRNPEFAMYTLQKNQRNYTKSKIQTKDLSKYVGKGLLTSEGELWKKQRRLIQPAFHKKQLEQLLDTVVEAIQKETNRIIPNTSIDIFPILNDLAFQTVAKALFKSEIDTAVIERLQYITEETQQMLVKELRQPFKALYFKYGGPVKKHINLTVEARGILKALVDQRRESGERQGDLLDMLLDARYEDGTGIEESQLLDEILILFVAGHETTSNALTFTLQLLARHQDVQEKVYTECVGSKEDSAFAKANTASLLAYIKHCEYTKQVIEESMRLYPPAYFVDRVNYKEDSFDEITIEKESNLLFSIIEIHKHKDFWEDPEAFNPDRFANNAGMKHKAYFPFGAGPRMCIGNNFAMYEMILAVTEIVKRYKIIAKDTPIEIKPLITLKPQNAMLEFIPR
ncbi:cytochrome P450 [uncultured Dokdonia sp.]|uniref:cytochrome P450 n=1 Tax=uncultured Dokdonia sp. TaxID=575653 RepID=UPI00260D8ABE|nr:cytochrome P450 [uncultured Dokdonia sp.]